MVKRNYGFTLIELLAVIVILAIIALVATPIMLGIIEDSQDNAGARSVEGYADSIVKTIGRYVVLHTEVPVITLCVGEAPKDTDFCHVDATKKARDNNVSATYMPDSTRTAVPVSYDGAAVICDAYVYNKDLGTITLSNCYVGDRKDDRFDYTSTGGAKKR
jgi:prepilin-type N-terminal cleavage/methylation domain-containing protein